MKKLILLLAVMVIIAVSGCTAGPGPTPFDNQTNTSNQTGNGNLEMLLLETEGTIPDSLCSERGLDNEVIVLESRYCGACRIAVPILKEIEEELQQEFIFLDLSQNEDLNRMYEFKIMPKYTPTILIGCDVHIGAKSKEFFRQAIEEFLGL